MPLKGMYRDQRQVKELEQWHIQFPRSSAMAIGEINLVKLTHLNALVMPYTTLVSPVIMYVS